MNERAEPPAQAPDTQRALKLGTRQLDLLHSIARGESAVDYAKANHVSVNTVKTHMRWLYRRLGVGDRAHAVAIGYETGLLKPGAVDTDHLWQSD
jgi:DNA-binding NarL/FixJ family response regulator